MEANGGGRRWPKRKKCKMRVVENSGKTIGKTTYLVKRRDAANIKHASQKCKIAQWEKATKTRRKMAPLRGHFGADLGTKKEAKWRNKNEAQNEQ